MKNDAKSQNFRLRRHLTQTSTSHEGAKQGGNLNEGGEFKRELGLIDGTFYLPAAPLGLPSNYITISGQP